ncbi:MAG: hypothetical protein A2X01_04660 [Bacteroidetes bacterium GWF2_35_48]|nr:MAG: hypothetical protein A2X01_04660 [Bacteroidetes bacterium GWF2_35_48]
MKKNGLILLILAIVSVLACFCKKEKKTEPVTEPMLPVYKINTNMIHYGFFKPGSWWVYEVDCFSGTFDSMWVESNKIDTCIYNDGTTPKYKYQRGTTIFRFKNDPSLLFISEITADSTTSFCQLKGSNQNKNYFFSTSFFKFGKNDYFPIFKDTTINTLELIGSTYYMTYSTIINIPFSTYNGVTQLGEKECNFSITSNKWLLKFKLVTPTDTVYYSLRQVYIAQ